MTLIQSFQRESYENVPIMTGLRLLTALEDLLGSLGPQINAMMGRAISLDNNRIGASNALLEDPDVAAILEMTKEKLAGQIVAGMIFKKLPLFVYITNP